MTERLEPYYVHEEDYTEQPEIVIVLTWAALGIPLVRVFRSIVSFQKVRTEMHRAGIAYEAVTVTLES